MPSAVVHAINKTDQSKVHHQIFSLNSSCCSAFLRDWKSEFQRNWKTCSLLTLATYATHFGNPNPPYTNQKRCHHICRHICHCSVTTLSCPRMYVPLNHTPPKFQRSPAPCSLQDIKDHVQCLHTKQCQFKFHRVRALSCDLHETWSYGVSFLSDLYYDGQFKH